VIPIAEAPESRVRRASASSQHAYWRASRFASTLLEEFRAALDAGQPAVARARFYVLARYFRRTLAIVHDALARRDGALLAAGLENAIGLLRVLGTMHHAAPDLAPSILALETDLHERVSRDLVHQVLREAPRPLEAAAILARFNELDLVADLRPPAVAEALASLLETGHIAERGGRYAPTEQPYIDVNADRAGLAMLVGPDLARILGEAGFEGLLDALERRADFTETLIATAGLAPDACDLLLAAAEVLVRPVRAVRGRGRWQGADLAGSAWPRPYQRLLHAILRGRDYAGQAIEAPNGSGKTLVGMLCIEDWLATLAPGQSILVLVPTVNYQQQWTGELCLKPSGLRLAPHLVEAGTPSTLERSRSGGALPMVLIVTYQALARLGSGAGQGGFAATEVERFLACHNVRHVVLDEVHKVVADPASPTSDAVRVMMEWLRDGSLDSVVGLSATLVGLEPGLAAIGLELACVLGPAELIAQGWVAAFTELGVPFSWSARERQVVAHLDEYRAALLAYLDAMGGPWLRAQFAAIPLEDRVATARRLGMYGRRRDADELIRRRVTAWETGGPVGLDELQLVSILQLARGWSDAALLEAAGIRDAFEPWLIRFDSLRAGLEDLLPAGPYRARAAASGLGAAIAAPAGRTTKDGPATTFTGLYLGLRDWSRQAGEGRVEVVRAVLAAERRSRSIPGVIVFDAPAPMRVVDGRATPGFRGAGGLFAELLDDPASVPMAALTSALYLPDRGEPPLHGQIAAWIVDTIVRRRQGELLVELLLAATGLEGTAAEGFRTMVTAGFENYVTALTDPTTSAPKAFRREVVRPARTMVRRVATGEGRHRALAVLAVDRHHPHLRAIVRATVDYARIARAFREARPVEVIRADGSARTLRMVEVPSGERRQRFLDLTARIVDAADLPVNVIVVSAWARTGWNVTSPNVLVDATATRDVIAWQQLRGRAMRPAPGWPAAAQRLVGRLGSGGPLEAAAVDGHPPLGRSERRFIRVALPAPGDPLRPWFERLASGEVAPEDLPAAVRERAAAHLLVAHNKVAHVYELVRGHGGSRQVRFDRHRRRWERIASIARKHGRELSVRASDGDLLAGPDHAPLIVAVDPRSDTPADLEARLTSELAAGDETIALGWLRAARGG
jgi:superfamily II DNA or RNA helicase